MNTKNFSTSVKNFDAQRFFGNLWEKIKYASREVWYFFSSKIFWINFGKMFGIFLAVMTLLFGFMYWVSDHGKSAKVGNFVNKHVTAAMKEARSAGFKIVTSDSVYRPDLPQNMVLKQTPKAGASVKDGRTIYLTISSTTGIAQLLLPLKTIGDFDSYAANLQAKGIKAERLPDCVYEPNEEDNTIKDIIMDGKSILAEVNEGKYRVMQGKTLQFKVSCRDMNALAAVDVPQVTCRQLGEIEVLLQAQSLTLGSITKDPSVVDERSAFVLSQEPRVGSGQVAKGTPVHVVLTQNRPAHCN